MNPCAAAVIAARPAAGGPPLICSEPSSAKNAATLAALRLHHAAVYLVAKSPKRAALEFRSFAFGFKRLSMQVLGVRPHAFQ